MRCVFEDFKFNNMIQKQTGHKTLHILVHLRILSSLLAALERIEEDLALRNTTVLIL